MSNNKSNLKTDAWLLKGTRSMRGSLKLSKGHLSFTAYGSGNFGRSHLRELEAAIGIAGLAEVLDNEEQAVLFEVPLTEVQNINFPWYYFSGGVKLTVNGVRHRFGFDEPANSQTSADPIGEVSKARKNGKAWKRVLLNH